MMRKFKIKNDFWTYATLGIFALFMVFLMYPLLTLVLKSFISSKTGAFTLDNFSKFFERKYYYTALINSLTVTVCVTFITILIGAPLAYIMSTVKIKFKGLVEVFIIISLLSPPFIGAYSWILLFGRSGVVTQFFSQVFGIELGSIYGFKGILIVFTLKLFPFIYLYVSGALKKVDVSLSEAAESLGCSSLKKVFTIIFPLILPTMLAGALLVFMNSLADFGTPMLIGEGFQVMPVLIYSEYISEVGGEANFSAALSVIVIVITMIVFSIQKYIINKKSYAMSSLRPITAQKIKGPKNFLAHAFVYGVVGLAIIPQITVIYTSFMKTKGSMFVKGFSLQSYETVISRMGSAILNTYKFGIVAIVCIIILGVMISYVTVRRRSLLVNILDTVIMMPYIIPGSVLGITLLLTFNHQPLKLSGTAFIIILIFVIRRLPYTVRSSSAILYQISPSLEEASISLGYSPMKTFVKVTAIMMMPGVFAGAIISWITIINELSASIILYTGMTKTMSVSIYTEVIRASYGTAAALSTILTITTVVSLLIFFRLTGKKELSL